MLDIGGANENGSYADIFSQKPFSYKAVDIKPGPGVDIVLEDPYVLPFPSESIDVVISGQALEHVEYFWKIFSEMCRVIKGYGYVFLIAPSAGPIHKFPVDCYRFYPDSFEALAKLSGVNLIDCYHDDRGPWKDLVGVFSKAEIEPFEPNKNLNCRSKSWNLNNYEKETNPFNITPIFFEEEYEIINGNLPHLEALRLIHDLKDPNFYLEIGVRNGRSLALSTCTSIGVDPDMEITMDIPKITTLQNCTSDDFFRYYAFDSLNGKTIDLAFIDGMHLFEFALRDFINIEKYADKSTVVIIDDICPNHSMQAERKRETRVWTGDIWKIHHCLAFYRPDLQITVIDTSPTGLLIVTGLNPSNTILTDNYNPILKKYKTLSIDNFQELYIERNIAIPPTIENINYAIVNSKINNKTAITAGISVVVVSFNMERELPRTLATLSVDYQGKFDQIDVEIIVVDNGSKKPTGSAENLRGVKVIYIENPSVSPARALNIGISEAKYDLVGVMIDGARMLSPRILQNAYRVFRSNPNSLIATISFHLGPDVQMKTVPNGYNQILEDELLESVDWLNDGYELFKVSALAGSSSAGFSELPTESNLFFLSARNWKKLGGFNEKFVSPGGGLVNLDTFKRGCEIDGIEIVVLLGEGTFHQVHGGIATNQKRKDASWEVFHEEYMAIRGFQFEKPSQSFLLHGTIRDFQHKFFNPKRGL